MAVSTNLLASIVAVLMRATGQTASVEGPLAETERRLAASRAILGEWLGGSGGGWQDSGGIWPGIKVISGARPAESDPEWGVSLGCLLPRHRILGAGDIHPETAGRITGSLVLIHGGIAQNVGPILEMVTEKYLLRGEAEWRARLEAVVIFEEILETLKAGDVKALAARTMRNWGGPLKTIIPWVTNRFTEAIIRESRERLGGDFWGFLMLGGMSGGGMAMFVAPERRAEFQREIQAIMSEAKAQMEDALPFAIEPLVYDFAINTLGSTATLLRDDDALMPSRYYSLHLPELVRRNPADVAPSRRTELNRFAADGGISDETPRLFRAVVGSVFRAPTGGVERERLEWDRDAAQIKEANGFDAIQHERTRQDLTTGRIGLARNRLPADTLIEDVQERDVITYDAAQEFRTSGAEAIQHGRVAIMTLAGGVGSRWTSGAGVIKALNPFVQIGGRHRNFVEIHLAKTRRTSQTYGAPLPHVFTTSFMTRLPIERHLKRSNEYGYDGPVYVSPGRSIGQRFIPMCRDLTFMWEELHEELLDEQKQKVREFQRAALLEWARACGEGSDYTDNVPMQRFNPPGHWYEAPNLILNGILRKILDVSPDVQTLMLHNIDTVGADVDPALLGAHLSADAALSFEVVPRRLEDRGGGLARVNGRLRLLEGLAQPREDDEFRLRYYNSMTTWISIDRFLAIFALSRDDLRAEHGVLSEAVRRVGTRMPTYVTIKEVKRRWGHGQEDIYPVAQVEKLWSDMSALSDVSCTFLAVPRRRGQQLKDPSQLDPWSNDGSKEYVECLCEFEPD